ncbi:helix-turn-helix domain-containing protein [Streptomyces rimosus]|uniref:helix-turn-helix domain-containing protein n=1 Tax=Streptomyces rimosus TaxID=1927 RepID=UPI00373AEB6C
MYSSGTRTPSSVMATATTGGHVDTHLPGVGRRRASVERQLAVGMSLLDERGMALAQPAERVGVTVPSLSVLKNDWARAIRYPTLSAICRGHAAPRRCQWWMRR